MGYDGYEFAGAKLASMTESEFQEMRDIAEAEGIPCVGINAYSSGTPAFVGENYSKKAAEEYAETVCSRAAALGAPNVGIGSPKSRIIPEDYDLKKASEQMSEFLSVTADTADGYSMGVLVEALRKTSCNYINTAESAVNAAKKCGKDNVRIVYDFYHAQPEEDDYIKSFEEYYSMVGHVHVSTCEADKTRGYPTERDDDEYRKIAQILKKMNYSGFVSIEPSMYDADMAGKSISYLKSL